MESRPLISIIIPTYQSEHSLENTLRSIRMQSIDSSEIEILCIDGGSTDRTREIALQYGAKVIENPMRMPEPAKHIGMMQATGKFLIKQDSDEEYVSQTQLEKRLDTLKLQPQIHCILADRLIPPKGSGIACAYLNAVGDPFTYFVYQAKGSITKSFAKHATKKLSNGAVVYQFQQDDVLPIGDGGTTMIDLDYVRKNFSSKMSQPSFVGTVFNDVLRATGATACIPGDDILHNSSSSIGVYLNKLKFRVINNVHQQENSGYSARAQSNKCLRNRKFLYPLYCLSIIFPIVDGIRLSMAQRDGSFLLHPFYAWYVLVFTALEMCKKWFGFHNQNHFYGNTK